MHLTEMICLWAGNLTPPNTPFTLIGNVAPFQLTGTRGRDIWPQMVQFLSDTNSNSNFNKFRLIHYLEETNGYFRYSIKINSNQSKFIN